MNKPHITVAEWHSNNEFNFIYQSADVVGKTPQYCESRVRHLFANNKYLAEAKLRGWNLQIKALHYDHDPECDCLDVYITMLHPDYDVTALESELIHKMLSHTQIVFKSATDDRAMAETFRSIDV